MANNYTISGVQGSTLSLNLNCTNSDGSVLNLSGYSISGYCKEKYSSTGKLFDLNVRFISPVSGSISISGAANDLENTPVGTYVYSVEAQLGDYIFKPLNGYLLIYPDAMNL